MKKGKKSGNNGEDEIYVRIDSSNSIESKKYLLEITESLIKMQMANQKVKGYGKKEVTYINGIKREAKSLNVLLSKTISDMPKIKVPKEIKKIDEKEEIMEKAFVERAMNLAKEASVEKGSEQKNVQKRPAKMTLNQELLDIKRKLEQLK